MTKRKDSHVKGMKRQLKQSRDSLVEANGRIEAIRERLLDIEQDFTKTKETMQRIVEATSSSRSGAGKVAHDIAVEWLAWVGPVEVAAAE